MTSAMFAKLAKKNIKGNYSVIFAYFLSSVSVVAMFNIMLSLGNNEFVRTRDAALVTMIYFGAIIIGIFSVVFILCNAGFLSKHRQKEMALYSMLGMTRKHLWRLLFFENLFISIPAILIGLLAGSVFGRLSFLILNKLTHANFTMEYQISLRTQLLTVGFFLLVFLLSWPKQCWAVRSQDPASLLYEADKVSEQPKGNILLGILSIVCIGIGYGLSIRIEDPLEAILFVVVGAYFMLMATSVILLRLMRKNKAYYYKQNHFIAVSGMLMRMKCQGIGMANITILLTMFIVSLTTTIAIYAGTEDWVNYRQPLEHAITMEQINLSPDLSFTETYQLMVEQDKTIHERLDSFNQEKGVHESAVFADRCLSGWGEIDGNQFQAMDDSKMDSLGQGIPDAIVFYTLDDYNQATEEGLELAERQDAYLMPFGTTFESDHVVLGDMNFHVNVLDSQVENVAANKQLNSGLSQIIKQWVLIVKDERVISDILDNYKAQGVDPSYFMLESSYGWETGLSKDADAEYANLMRSQDFYPEQAQIYSYETKSNLMAGFYATNGGFLFLGLFLGLMFLVGIILITYFKQLSEGYEDKKSFAIMQAVGLDGKMIRNSTRVQILWLFFLPLMLALLHTLVASPAILKLIKLFYIYDAGIYFKSLSIVVIGIMVIYGAVFHLTSNAYYQIVRYPDRD